MLEINPRHKKWFKSGQNFKKGRVVKRLTILFTVHDCDFLSIWKNMVGWAVDPTTADQNLVPDVFGL